jgi:hypothetical protein
MQIIAYTKNKFMFKIINDDCPSSSRKRSPKSKTSQRFVFENVNKKEYPESSSG